MTEDEFFVGAVAVFLAGLWFKRKGLFLLRRQQWCDSMAPFFMVLIGVLGASLFLFWLLGHHAAEDVVTSPLYRTYYLVVGLGWITGCLWLLPWVGLSFRDDVLERGNIAAAFAVGGAFVATTLIYGFANTGDGPGWWCVLIAAGLSQIALFAGWVCLLGLSELFEEITVDRDIGAGLRSAAWFVASGAVLGRAAAGTWSSFEATVREFLEVAIYFPALIASGLLIEIALRRFYAGSPDPHPYITGLGGAVLHLGIAAAILERAGPWS